MPQSGYHSLASVSIGVPFVLESGGKSRGFLHILQILFPLFLKFFWWFGLTHCFTIMLNNIIFRLFQKPDKRVSETIPYYIIYRQTPTVRRLRTNVPACTDICPDMRGKLSGHARTVFSACMGISPIWIGIFTTYMNEPNIGDKAFKNCHTAQD